MDHYLDQVAATMRDHGWAVQGVLGGATAPPFAYTVGLTNFAGHPEVIIFGVDHDTARSVLNELGRRVREGARLRAGQRLEGLLEADYPLILVAVTDPAAHLSVARRLLGDHVAALQVVWPDPAGHFPWDAAHDPRFTVMQPLLGPPPGLAVYAPTPGRLPFIDRGSGIVGSAVAAGQVLVDYEGNRVGARNLVTYADLVAQASSRHAERAPTSARALVDAAELRLVGRFDPELGVVSVEDPAALAAWLDVETVPAEQLRTTWDVHARRRFRPSS